MVGRTRKEPDALAIQFDRDGEPSEKEIVSGGGERVLLFAVAMLIRQRELRLHDRLIVRAADDDEEGRDG
jgi:hypothetical protein